ncbi:hypothetical protein AB3329_07305 [Streptococcus sp. H31]|uniref:hypothetical protein n=1 Tax=Streptococcus huangxiaojuni TaxID=3237239 RepID=UPI0034A1B159
MELPRKKLFNNISEKVTEKKNLFPSVPILLVTDVLLIIGYCILYYVKADLKFIYLLTTCIALIKVIIAFHFCQELSYSKLSKVGYSLFFFLFFWSLSFISLRQLTGHFSKIIDLSHLPNYLLIFLFNLLAIFFTKWLVSNKPWIHVLTDFFSLLILIPVFYYDNLPQILITPFFLVVLLLRYLIIIKFLSKKWSFLFKQRCMIVGELLSFYFFLTIIVAVSKQDELRIAVIATILLYILTLYARILLFISYSFKMEEAKKLFVFFTIYICTISLLAFLLYILPGEKGTNIITFLLPAIIPILFRNLANEHNNTKKKIVSLNKFQITKNFFNVLFFYTTIAINILASLASTAKIPFLLLSSLKSFFDYMILVMDSTVIGALLTIISLLLFQAVFEQPKNGFIKMIPNKNNRKFPQRVHKRH